MLIGLMVRELCTNVLFIALWLINVPQGDKNIKMPWNNSWTDTNILLGSKVTCKNLQYIDRT